MLGKEPSSLSYGSHGPSRPGLPWLLGGLFILGAILGVSIFSIWSWQQTRTEIVAQLRTQSEFVANSANTLFTSLKAGLPDLAGQIDLTDDRPNKSVYITLAEFLKTHPYIANLVLFSPNGQMLLNTAIPYKAPLPDAQKAHTYPVVLGNALQVKGLQVGLTRRDLLTGAWHLTVSYVLRNTAGQPIAILQANLPIDELTGQWASMSLIHGTAIGLLRTDGHLLARLPEVGPMASFYAKQYNGGLVSTLRKNHQAISGQYTGVTDADNRDRIGFYTHLDQVPVVAFVSLPRSKLLAIWAHRLIPVLGIGFLGLFGYMALIAALFSRERKHAAELSKERDRHLWIARHDPLTQLPNRIALEERLEEGLARTRRKEDLLAVGLFDLDDFKLINDRYGHAVGDQLLNALGQILSNSIRETDYIARLGGDEFVFLFEALSDMDDLLVALNRVQRSLEQPIRLREDITLTVSGSLGLSVYPFDDVEPDILLRHADLALYRSKESKGTRQNFWTLYDHRWAYVRPHINALKRIIAGELKIYYQPILDLQTNRIVSVEALARIIDAQTGETYSPSQFLGELLTCEDHLDLISEVLNQVDTDIESWDKTGLEKLSVSVNLPPELMSQSDWCDDLLNKLAVMKTAAHRLTFEVLETESSFPLTKNNACIKKLKRRGYRFVLDDIGSAYSTLLRLKELPVDGIKLDQAFVRELRHRPQDLIFVEALMGIADVLGINFICEGVETPEILDALIALRVPKVQGFAISTPIPADQLVDWLQQYRPPVHTPHTLLGLYATHRQKDYFLHSLFAKNQEYLPMLPDKMWLGHAEVKSLLHRLGHGGSDLEEAYQRYHGILQSILDQKGPLDKEMVAAYEEAATHFDSLLEESIRNIRNPSPD